MKVLVTGGRDYNDMATVWRVLEGLDPDVVVCGGARGADTLAIRWAVRNCKEVQVYSAEWDRYGKSAGAIRNQRMVDLGADLVVAFPGGCGTADCIKKALKAGLVVRQVDGEGS